MLKKSLISIYKLLIQDYREYLVHHIRPGIQILLIGLLGNHVGWEHYTDPEIITCFFLYIGSILKMISVHIIAINI